MRALERWPAEQARLDAQRDELPQLPELLRAQAWL